MKILYENVDIYPEISVNSLYHTMHCEKKADELTLVLNDTEQLWNTWNPKKGQTISVEDDAAKTGKMYVQSVRYESSLVVINALSMPQSIKDKRSKSWEKVRFLQLAQEVADNNDLTLQTVGVTDQEYQYVQQNNESDASFLYRRCLQEGVAYLIFDGKLVLYDEQTMEGKSASETLTITPSYSYSYEDNCDDAYTVCTITNGQLNGAYQTSGDQEKELHVVIPYAMSDQAEADRVAQNYLRQANKGMCTMVIWTEYMARSIAAGSVVNIETDGTKSWNGSAFVTDIRHDYVHNTSKIWLRKPLEGY